jgi:glycosyltransferase involved in cell wall biosynthesis
MACFDPGDQSLIGRLTRIRARIAAASPDLLLTYNWGAVEWALANRLRPICSHIHFEDGFGAEEADGQLRRRVLARRVALSGNSRVVVPSLTLRDVARHIWKLSEARILFVPNGVDCARFEDGAGRACLANWRTSPDTLLIGTVAALRPEKNVARLIRSVAPLVERFDVRLVIAGEGGERAALEKVTESLRLTDRVIFLGAVAGAEKVLPLLDVFALSSDTEQMPLTLLEAMAARLPVAAVDVGDVQLMLPPACRHLVVPRDDPARLTDALATLLADPQRRSELGRLNHAHVHANYSLKAMLATYDGLLS